MPGQAGPSVQRPELVAPSKEGGWQGNCIGPSITSFNPHHNSREGLNPSGL